MNIETVWLLLQISTVLGLAWGVGVMFQDRYPQAVARTSLVGMIGAVLVLCVAGMGIELPWSFSLEHLLQQFQEATDQATVTSDDSLASTSIARQPPNGDAVSLHFLSRMSAEVTSWLRNSSTSTPSWLQQVQGWGLALAWLICIAAMLRLMLGIVAGCMMFRTSDAIDAAGWSPAMRSLWSRNGFSQSYQLRISRLVKSPCIHMLFPRTIFLPVGALQWSEVEITTALAHEMAHHRRRDSRFRLISELCWVLLAYHPLALLLRRQQAFCEELSADLDAAEYIGNREQYRLGLSRLCLRLDQAAAPTQAWISFGLGVLGLSSGLIRRIKMLQKNRLGQNRTNRRFALAVMTGLTLATVTVGGWRLRADEPQPQGKNDSPKATLFQRSTEFTPTGLNPSEAIITLRPAEAAKNPALKALLALAQSSANSFLQNNNGVTAISLQEVGLNLAEVQELQLIPQVVLEQTEITAGEPTSDKDFSLSVGAKQFYIHAAQAVDWPRLIESIPPAMLGTQPAQLKQIAASFSAGEELLVESGEANGGQVTPSDRLLKLHEQVGGGVIAAVLPAPDVSRFMARLQQFSAEDQEVLKALSEIKELAIGADVVEGSTVMHIRGVITANDQTTSSDLLASINKQHQSIIEKMEAEDGASPATQVLKRLEFRAAEHRHLGSVVTFKIEVDPVLMFGGALLPGGSPRSANLPADSRQ